MGEFKPMTAGAAGTALLEVLAAEKGSMSTHAGLNVYLPPRLPLLPAAARWWLPATPTRT